MHRAHISHRGVVNVAYHIALAINQLTGPVDPVDNQGCLRERLDERVWSETQLPDVPLEIVLKIEACRRVGDLESERLTCRVSGALSRPMGVAKVVSVERYWVMVTV